MSKVVREIELFANEGFQLISDLFSIRCDFGFLKDFLRFNSLMCRLVVSNAFELY